MADFSHLMENRKKNLSVLWLTYAEANEGLSELSAAQKSPVIRHSDIAIQEVRGNVLDLWQNSHDQPQQPPNNHRLGNTVTENPDVTSIDSSDSRLSTDSENVDSETCAKVSLDTSVGSFIFAARRSDSF